MLLILYDLAGNFTHRHLKQLVHALLSDYDLSRLLFSEFDKFLVATGAALPCDLLPRHQLAVGHDSRLLRFPDHVWPDEVEWLAFARKGKLMRVTHRESRDKLS